MLLPTVSSSGGKWRCCCRQLWDMLMSPISPRNLRTTALLTSIYQLVSSLFLNKGLENLSSRLIRYVGISALGPGTQMNLLSSSIIMCSLNPQNTKITHWICKAIPHRARRFPSKTAIEALASYTTLERGAWDESTTRCVRTRGSSQGTIPRRAPFLKQSMP